MDSLLFLILDIIGLIILIKWLIYQWKDFRKTRSKKDFFKVRRFKIPLIAVSFVFIPLLLVNNTDIETLKLFPLHSARDLKQFLYAFFISSFISIMWLYYLYNLDIFNKEKKRHLLFVFLFSGFITLFVPFLYQLLIKYGINLSKDAGNNFLYSVFVIGLIEESAKLIPLLILIRFTKAVDEPFDYILFASISALGFSLVENTGYLFQYGLEIINARALYATIAHMAFSSMIAYALFLIKYKQSKFPAFFILILFYFFAIFSHGFYDFWYLTPSLHQYHWVSTVFLLLIIHLWFSMKNNTLNMSDFYDESRKINNDNLKVYLSVGLLAIFMFSYVYVAFSFNSSEANKFFKKSLLIYGYIIFYIIATITKYDLVRGFIKPFKWSLHFLVPGWKKTSKNKK